jgi:selenocysteine-specific elongation factor
MIIGVAGHIDHGKTSLVRALTGIETDRLKEEKARGITIEPGFAHWRLPGGQSLTFIDMPGHERFLPAMLTGAAAADAVLLVVAADDGVMPQTLEHLAVARLLGIRRGVVALTKYDLVAADRRGAPFPALARALAEAGLERARIVPVSSLSGEGLPDLAAELAALACAPSFMPADRRFRLWVDRAFSISGAGTVVTGTVRAGRVRPGDRLLLQPAGREARVRGLQRAGDSVEEAVAGDRVAVNLAGVTVEAAARGTLLAAIGSAAPVTGFDAVLTALAPDWPPARGASDLRLHVGAAETGAKLSPLERRADGRHLVRIVAATPLPLLVGERFVLRGAASRRVVGGGEALDIYPPSRGRSRPERLAALAAGLATDPALKLRAILEHPPHAVPRERFAASLGLPGEAMGEIEVRAGALSLPAEGDRLLVAAGYLVRLRREIVEAVGRFHATEPELPGLSLARLAARLAIRLDRQALPAIVEDMRRRGELAAGGSFLAMPGHLPALSAAHQALWAAILPRISGERLLHAPTLAELALDLRQRPEVLRGLMKRLSRRGDVLEVAEDRYFLVEAVTEMASRVRETGGAWFSAAEYRDRLGIGRKVAILALEFFDRRGLTLRDGDRRRLNPQRAGLFRATG